MPIVLKRMAFSLFSNYSYHYNHRACHQPHITERHCYHPFIYSQKFIFFSFARYLHYELLILLIINNSREQFFLVYSVGNFFNYRYQLLILWNIYISSFLLSFCWIIIKLCMLIIKHKETSL